MTTIITNKSETFVASRGWSFLHAVFDGLTNLKVAKIYVKKKKTVDKNAVAWVQHIEPTLGGVSLIPPKNVVNLKKKIC